MVSTSGSRVYRLHRNLVLYGNNLRTGVVGGGDMLISPYEPSREWDKYCEEQEREAEKRPLCCLCNERILDEYCYEVIDGEYICESCMESRCKVGTPIINYEE